MSFFQCKQLTKNDLYQTFLKKSYPCETTKKNQQQFFIQKIYTEVMDPTKPILDIYNNSFYSNKQKSKKEASRSQIDAYPLSSYTNAKSSVYKATSSKANRNHQQPSYSELKDKYQELYQAYHEKVDKLNRIQTEIDRYRIQNSDLKQQFQKAKEKNHQLQSSLMQRNLELEDCYRRLQDEVKGNSRIRGQQSSIERLQDGLRQAIQSNFQLLKESTLSELRSYIV